MQDHAVQWIDNGTQTGPEQKSQAICQAADADSLNSLAHKLLRSRALLQREMV